MKPVTQIDAGCEVKLPVAPEGREEFSHMFDDSPAQICGGKMRPHQTVLGDVRQKLREIERGAA